MWTQSDTDITHKKCFLNYLAVVTMFLQMTLRVS